MALFGLALCLGGLLQAAKAADDPAGLEFFENKIRPILVDIEKEARASSALNHPNILVIYEFGQVNGLYFIASEFVDGPTLTQMLESGGLSF